MDAHNSSLVLTPNSFGARRPSRRASCQTILTVKRRYPSRSPVFTNIWILPRHFETFKKAVDRTKATYRLPRSRLLTGMNRRLPPFRFRPMFLGFIWVDSEVFIRGILNARSGGRSRRSASGKIDWGWTWGKKGSVLVEGDDGEGYNAGCGCHWSSISPKSSPLVLSQASATIILVRFVFCSFVASCLSLLPRARARSWVLFMYPWSRVPLARPVLFPTFYLPVLFLSFQEILFHCMDIMS